MFNRYAKIKLLLNNNTHKHNLINIFQDEFGEKLGVMLFDDVPNDPELDFQFKCYLDSISLLGYDDNCNEFKAYL